MDEVVSEQGASEEMNTDRHEGSQSARTVNMAGERTSEAGPHRVWDRLGFRVGFKVQGLRCSAAKHEDGFPPLSESKQVLALLLQQHISC